MPPNKRRLGQLTNLAWQLARFGLVGGAATVIHLATAWILLWQWPGISPFIANLIAFLLAFQVSFWGHSRFTFGSEGSPARFLVVSGSGFLLNNALLALLLLTGFFSSFAAICLAAFLVPLFVFLASKFWVFPS
jgi:putative flippase GtrA